MALRLVEVVLPANTEANIQETLDGESVIDIWTTALDDEAILGRILVPVEQTESVTDTLSNRFGHFSRFRVMLVPVEATMPLPEEGETEDRIDLDEEPSEESQPMRISREELYQDVAGAAELSKIYLVTIILSTIVAAIGLVRDDVAIIIGSMVIAPLLGPNVALSLGSTLGDLALVGRAAKTLAVGLVLIVLFATGVGLLIQFDPQTPAIWSRTSVSLTDIILAFAAGSAGTLAFTSGFSTAVIGVMVAVALLPPAVVVGLLLGAGSFQASAAALVLLFTNIAGINITGVITFLLQQVRPREWWEAESAKRATRIAIVLWIIAILLLVGLILII